MIPQVRFGFLKFVKLFIHFISWSCERQNLKHQTVQQLHLFVGAQLVDGLGAQGIENLRLVHPELEAGVIVKAVTSSLLVGPNATLFNMARKQRIEYSGMPKSVHQKTGKR